MAETNLTPIYQEYCIDMSSNNNFVQIPSVQGDGNYVRYVRIMLIENNIQYVIPEGVGVFIVGTKPDTLTVFNECEVDENGLIVVEITSQMTAVAGRGDYQIMLIDIERNSQLKTFPFYLITTKSYDAEQITSSNEYQALTKALAEMKADYEVYVIRCEDAATAASASESNSAESEANALASETAAKASEEIASASAESASASKDAAEISANNAYDSETAARASELAASASEIAAKASEDNAKASEDNAKISEDNAKASEDASALSETNAKTSEDNAKLSEDNAKISEDNAKASELAAATSVASIGNAEQICTDSADSASNYATLARQWAVWQDGDQTPSNTNNARYWANKAKEWSGFDDIDATSVTYTKEDGTKVVLADYLKFLEDLDGETILVL